MHTITVSMGSTVGLHLLLLGFSFRYLFIYLVNNLGVENLRLTLYFLVGRCSSQMVSVLGFSAKSLVALLVERKRTRLRK